MLYIHDIRETRVFQEGVEEGLERGMKKGAQGERQRQRREKLKAIAKMAALKISPAKIAEILELDIKLVRKELAKRRG